MVRPAATKRVAFAVHGGAGRFAPDDQEPVLAGCLAAVAVGAALLHDGATAVDAVEAAICVLEDNPLFNAGVGSVLNLDGVVEMDAAIMDGATLRAGAVAAVSHVRHPISLGRRVMEDGRHVLLAGAGARLFAAAHGIPDHEPSSLVTERQRARWADHYGTVGAVALDSAGRVAAGTSTGGIFGKLPGRVGDSALIGSGTYANEARAVSCTGMGEAIIRMGLAHSVAAADAGDPWDLAQRAIAGLNRRLGAQAGVIVLDAGGVLGWAHSTPDMPVAYLGPDGPAALMRTPATPDRGR